MTTIEQPKEPQPVRSEDYNNFTTMEDVQRLEADLKAGKVKPSPMTTEEINRNIEYLELVTKIIADDKNRREM